MFIKQINHDRLRGSPRPYAPARPLPKERHWRTVINSLGFGIKKTQVQIKLLNILEPQDLHLLNGHGDGIWGFLGGLTCL